MRGIAWVLVGALLALAGAVGAQQHHWSDGDVEIVNVHPDLVESDDGAVHSSGDFFAQSVLRGEDAGEVEEVAFSFGVGPPSPVYHPGYVGLWDYRVDDTPEDGWFISLTTSDQIDGEFRYAAHAYTTAGDPSSEIARLWGAAVVDNENGDDVGPWPSIQPGETERIDNPHGERGVTIEFAENATAELFVDGEPVELEPWTPPARDDDDIPRHTSEERVLAEGYRWPGDVQKGTVLRVDAVDEAGNEVTKGALAGFGIDNPVIEVLLVGQQGNLTPGRSASLDLEVANIGLQAGQVTLSPITPGETAATIPQASGLELDAGGSEQVTMDLEIPDGEPIEGRPVGVEASYPIGDDNATSAFTYTVSEAGLAGDDVDEAQLVETDEDEAGDELAAQAEDGDGDGQAIPMAGAWIAFALIAAALARRGGDR